MIVYILFIPLTLAVGSAMGYFSLQSAMTQNWSTFIILVAINITPTWALISRYSKNLIFDELLYSTGLMGSYLITVSWLDDSNTFSILNWLGLLIAFIGFILMKLTWEEKKI